MRSLLELLHLPTLSKKEPDLFFASYSHDDREFVRSIIQFLRLKNGQVFFDVDIPHGVRWQEEIDKAVAGCSLFLLFWCKHSMDSEAVQHEWTLALRQGRSVVPVLLDFTPLPAPLSEFQWIDCRALAKDNHYVWSPGGDWEVFKLVAFRLQEFLATRGL